MPQSKRKKKPSNKIIPIAIEEELKSSYLDYAMSIIISRALPDVRDGLKPVQRRILFALNQLGLKPNSPFKKSARVVGEVLGKYHPHGDAPVYEAMVRMAQDFTMRYVLVEGQGNFGSIDGDPPAAMRYTEVRLSPIGLEMLSDIDKGTTDFIPNFDGTTTEPVVLPSPLPNLLINGSSGIAVGMATNIPPHNLGEVCDAIALLIDNPEATLDEIMEYIKGPDFPTGGIIEDREGIKLAYATGKGKIILKGKVEVEKTEKGKEQIVISEIPFQTNKSALIERIAQLVKEKRIEGIAEVRDESDRHGIRLVIELKRTASPQEVLEQLYNNTPLRSPFFINMLALVNGEPKVLPLKEILKHYIDFRYEVVSRRLRYEIEEAKERGYVLEGIKTALENLEQVIAIIRLSTDAASAQRNLIKAFSLSERQAQAILEIPLKRLSRLERGKIIEEISQTEKRIGYLEGIEKSPSKILQIIKEEVMELKKKYGDERRTRIMDVSVS